MVREKRILKSVCIKGLSWKYSVVVVVVGAEGEALANFILGALRCVRRLDSKQRAQRAHWTLF
jgi:hypothetical protein